MTAPSRKTPPSPSGSRILGIDLAAQPPKTGLCVLESAPGALRVQTLVLGVTDQDILEASRGAAKIGVDAPLGWPDEFVGFVAAQHAGEIYTLLPYQGKAGLDRLSFRETDRDVHARLHKLSLSVSADKIARVAMRAAVLQAHWSELVGVQPRDGSEILTEVYPAATLLAWFGAGPPPRAPTLGPAAHSSWTSWRGLPRGWISPRSIGNSR